jgi:hypothetical protein
MSEQHPAPASPVERESEATTAAQDHAYHYYTSNVIPWSVRVIWLGFWIFAVWYVIANLFPALQIELISPP